MTLVRQIPLKRESMTSFDKCNFSSGVNLCSYRDSCIKSSNKVFADLVISVAEILIMNRGTVIKISLCIV
jgi:hypothetical protein